MRTESLAASVRRLGVALVAATLALAITAGPAGAEGVRELKEAFGSAEQPSFTRAAKLAFDPATQALLVVDDPADGESALLRFNKDGTPFDFPARGDNSIEPLPGFGSPNNTPVSVNQIAVDSSGPASPTDGNIYVTQDGPDTVEIFSAEGAHIGQLSASGPTPFPSRVCGVAVDGAGAVYVATGFADDKIHKFVPSGAAPVNADWVKDFSFNNPCNIAAGAGATAGFLFVVEALSSGTGPLRKLDVEGAEEGEVKYQVCPGTGAARDAVVEPGSGHVFTATSQGSQQRVVECDASGPSAPVDPLSRFSVASTVHGIAVDGGSDEVYVSRQGASGIEVYGPTIIVPTVTTEAASEVKGTKATLNGTVNPDGLQVTECFFEYGPTSAYGSIEPCEPAAGSIPADESDHAVSAQLGGLQPNTAYNFRLVAVNAEGTNRGLNESFSTKNPIIDQPASEITDTTATLNAEVNPFGAEVDSCIFEYGTTTAYGSTAPCEGAIPADEEAHPVSAAIAGLAPNGTTYHFRAVVELDDGETVVMTNGANRSFQTALTAVTRPATEVTGATATLNAEVDPFGKPFSECFFEYGTTTAYGQVAPCAESEAEIGSGTGMVPVHAEVAGLNGGTTYHFRIVATNAAGTARGEDETLQTLGPVIVAWSEEVTFSEAVIRARIEPEGGPTTYRAEYLTEADFQANGNSFSGPNPPTVLEGSEALEATTVVGFTLRGLARGTSYRYRFLATNAAGVNAGDALGFATYRSFAPETSCPNQAFRTAASAFLPDCRAYEMVSPVDKNGGNILNGMNGSTDVGGRVQASPDGDGLAYSAVVASFAGQQSSFAINQYLAFRDPGQGWITRGLHPGAIGRPVADLFGLLREFSGFTPDLCSAWMVDRQTPSPVAGAQEGNFNLYRRQNCGPGAGSFEALTTVEPSDGTSVVYVNEYSVQGASDDGRHAFFVAAAKLTEDASSAVTGVGTPIAQLYDRFDGELKLVSVLPDGSANPAASAVGSGRGGNQDGAVAADGSWAYWSTGGKIYLRRHPGQGIVAGECTAPGLACTLPVSVDGDALFWAASADGSEALYSKGNLGSGAATLYRHDVQAGESQEVAANVRGVAGTSEDLARIYFVSDDALAGAAQAGEPNLYLDHEGDLSFVATLIEGDIDEPSSVYTAYNVASTQPITRATRVSPDGTHIAFQSRAPLTGFDNTDPGVGEPVTQVFLYQAEGGDLLCVSCNPSGARPRGSREMPETYFPYRGWFNEQGEVKQAGFETNVFGGGWIRTWEHPLHASNLLSQDGGRLFFNSNDALLPRDANGAQDVYQWEAPGTGRCDTDDADYFPKNGGCLALISSGTSSSESEFWEASPDGEDVFFTTAASLVETDPGSIDLYDARVGGGFPRPSRPAACEGEACQSPPPPPEFDQPASGAYRGPGNVPHARNCRGRAVRAAKLSRQAKRARRIAIRARRDGNRALTRRMRGKAQRFSGRAAKLSRNAKRCRRANRRAGR